MLRCLSQLTWQKGPVYPAAQLQEAVRPASSTQYPPCRQGALSQGPGAF